MVQKLLHFEKFKMADGGHFVFYDDVISGHMGV